MTQTEQRILDLVSEIEQHSNRDDDDLISNAMRLAELRRLIKQGAAGPNVKWTEWAIKNIPLSASRLYELLMIADARDPKAKLEQLRRLTREKQKRYVGARTSTDTERLAVIKLIKVIKLDEVRKVRQFLHSLTGR